MHLQHGQLCMVVCMYAALPEHTLQCCALHANAMLCCALAASERGELRMMDLRMVPHLQANTGTPGLEAGSVHQGSNFVQQELVCLTKVPNFSELRWHPSWLSRQGQLGVIPLPTLRQHNPKRLKLVGPLLKRKCSQSGA
eukprot:1157234-Pelagomonas_calceolata.AAC.6